MWRSQRALFCLLFAPLLLCLVYGDSSPDHHRERRELMICQSQQCKNLVSRLQRGKNFYKYYVHTYCENGRCEDTVTEWFVDGTKRVHKCDQFGCALSNNANTVNNNLFDRNSLNDRGASPEPNKPSIVCQSPMCKDFINKLKAEAPYSRYDIKTSCINDICEDEITVEYSNNSKDYFVCRQYGCSIKGAPTVPVRITTTARTTTKPAPPWTTTKTKPAWTTTKTRPAWTTTRPTPPWTTTKTKPAWTTTKTTPITTPRPRPRGPCRTTMCQGYYDDILSNGGYTTLSVESVLQNNEFKDILTVTFGNGKPQTYECFNRGCTKLITTTTTTTMSTATSVVTSTVESMATTTARPRGACRTSLCQEYFDQVVANNRYTLLNLEIVCGDINACKDIFTVRFDNGETWSVECGATSCKQINVSEQPMLESSMPTTEAVLPTKQTTSTTPPTSSSTITTTVKQTVETTASVLPTKQTTVGKRPVASSLQSPTKTPKTAQASSQSSTQASSPTTPTATTKITTTSTPASTKIPTTTTTTKKPSTPASTTTRKPTTTKPPKSTTQKPSTPTSTTTATTKTTAETTTAEPEKVCKLPVEYSPRIYCSLNCSECSKDNSDCYIYRGSEVKEPVTRIECLPGNRLAEDRNYTLVACVNGQWQGQFSECLPLCPALESESMIPTCSHNGKEVDCGKPMLPGTTATVQCRPGYSPYQTDDKEEFYGRTFRCKMDGKWSANLPECKANCGISKGSAIVEATIALDGLSTPLGVFPWHAGLYQKEDGQWKYICGGTLITKQVVVSAAHCIRVGSYEELSVTFAKYYRDWDKDEKDTVKRNVSDISIPKEFSAAITTLLWDIALLLLSEPVTFNSFVMPVCVLDTFNIDPAQNFTAYVVGWGKTKADGDESDFLLHNNVSVVLQNSCDKEYAAKLVTFDKFCASKEGTSVVEKGDSGGGLTTVYNQKHYLIGIVSVKYNKVSMFTNFTWTTHVNWRRTEVTKFEDNLSRCPESGFLCGLSGPCLSKSVRCDGYQQCPDASDETGCGAPGLIQFGQYPPPGCSPPKPIKHGGYKVVEDKLPYSYILQYTCQPGYKKSVLSSLGSCEGGGLVYNEVDCVPANQTVCGVPDNYDIYKDKERFPWMVALYIRGNGSWEHYCSGTLVSKQFVFTAARCLVNPVILNRPGNIKVGLGKYRGRILPYRYADIQDSIIVDVDDTAVPQFYSGSANKYAADVGLVHLKTPAIFDEFVTPICLDYSSYKYISGSIVTVPTWGAPQNGADTGSVLSSNAKFIGSSSCFKELKPANQRLLTYDKDCARFFNGTSIGDLETGAGLTVIKDGKYFVYGVVSSVIKEDDAPPLYLITDIYNRENFGWLQWLLDQETQLQNG